MRTIFAEYNPKRNSIDVYIIRQCKAAQACPGKQHTRCGLTGRGTHRQKGRRNAVS